VISSFPICIPFISLCVCVCVPHEESMAGHMGVNGVY
jgi:hypothetical protein